MAVFGMPGGAEWFVILMTVLLLFVPGAGLVGIGYLLGRRSTRDGDGPGATPRGDLPAPEAPSHETHETPAPAAEPEGPDADA